MRLHSLSITAFGPFADTAEVDFDALSDAGLFLLSGPTGAGKSSILDAVCFALYGDVPGDRSTAGRLRCDQAPDGATPRVRLDVTLSGRRFRIERSPKWDRPKKRGTGMTTQQATVVISEWIEDGWQPLSTRLDETGHLITRLVGLNMSQFTQVAMLPQGRFQAFLRARSEERHALLRQVFRTERFDQIEHWLRDRRLDLQRTSAAHGRAIAQLMSRISETADQQMPCEWTVADLALEASEGTLARWIDDLTKAARVAVDSAVDARDHAAGVVAESANALAAGRTLAQRQKAHAAALSVIEAHDEEAFSDLCSRAQRADRSEPLTPLEATVAEDAALLADLERETATATAAWQRAAGAESSAPVHADLPSLLSDAGRSLEQAEGALPTAQELSEISRLADETAERLSAVTAEAARVAATLASAPDRLRSTEAALAAAEAAALRLPACVALLTSARRRSEAAHEVIVVSSTVEQAGRAREAARDRLAQLKETWLEIREARLDGMAAEIAGALAVGGSCPVCGSHEHPHLAAAAAGSPDAATERAARKEVDDSEALLVVLDDQLRESESRQTRLLTLAEGQTVDEADLALVEVERTHHLTAAAAETLSDQRAIVNQIRAAHDDLRLTHEAAVQQRAELFSQVEHLRYERQRLSQQIDEVLAGTRCATVAELVTLRTRQHCAIAKLCGTWEKRVAAARDLAKAERALADAARGAGFASVKAALSARLGQSERSDLATEISHLADALRGARTVVDDPDQQAAAALIPADVEALLAAHAEAEVQARAAHARHDEGVRRHTRLCTLGDHAATELDSWSPVRDELRLTSGLAHFVEGKSPDNSLQMRLSAYVLAHRLTQVVASANERLAGMSDQRYSLEHTGRRGAGETRGGLSLLVRDDWSGESRDPATLSGGETFVVSLALALGLADVITQEAGGADLDTLFVDEGFGSLDADTLDDVMDTLDRLRDGGRVVGVVSHVAEMQTRIPSQLRVTKDRAGSQVSVCVG